MKDFSLEVYPNMPRKISDRCRICDMFGLGKSLTYRVVLNDQIVVWSCAKHIRHAINDVFAESSVNWRIWLEPVERIESGAVHTIAADLLKLCTLLREPRRIAIADQIRSLALRVHEAARYLEHYENLYGGNEDE